MRVVIRRVAIGLVAASLLLSLPPAGADEGPPPDLPHHTTSHARSLTLAEAIDRARDQSQQVRQANAEVLKAGIAVDEAWMSRLPSLNLDAQYINNVSLPTIVLPSDSPFGGDVLRTGNTHNLSATAQASMPIYSAQLNRSIDLARAAEGLEKTLQQATVREVETEAQRAYINSLMAQEALDVLLASHRTLQQNLNLIQSLYDEGMVPEFDLIRTDVQVRNLEPELSRARTNLDGALNYLKLLTGIAIADEIHLLDSLEEIYRDLPPPHFEPLFANNRQLLQLDGQRQLLDHRLHLERAAYLPTLSAFGNFTYQGQSDDLAIWDYQWTDTASVGLAISIPLFTGGLRQRIEQVEIEQRQLHLQRQFLEQSLRSQFQTLRHRLRELLATIDAQQRTIAQAERGYQIAQASYEEGVHTLMEVNDAESALTEARLNYKSALADYIHAVLDMEELLGTIPSDTDSRD